MPDRLQSWLSSPARPQARAVSTVIGFVLIFGILILVWTSYQSIAVPQQNKEAEFNHNQRVQGQMLDLRDAILRTGTTGVTQSVSITVGADYPRRALAVNFAVTGGRVVTTKPNPDGSNNITIRNAVATRAEVKDYFDASGGNALNFSTKDIVYSPVYTRYSQAPDTTISMGTAFNQFRNANLSLGDQILVDGNQITIVAIGGNLTAAKSGEGASVSFETEGLSVAENSITIKDSGSRIELTFPSTVANTSAWNESSLEDEENVHNVSVNGNFVTVYLDKGTYSLRMMKVGVGSDTTEPGARYLTDIDAPSGSVIEESSTEITLEVRDKFNNPVDGVQVNASIHTAAGGANENLTVIGESEFVTGTSGVIDANTSDGQVTFKYTAPDVSSKTTVKLNFTIDQQPFTTAEQVWVNTSVVDNDGGGGGGGDATGPQISNIDTNGTSNSDREVVQGAALNLTATANDRGRGGSDIIDAEWWSNRTNPGGSAGNGWGLKPVDSELDQAQEDLFNASLDTATWTLGWHNLSLRAQDANNNWGPESYYEIKIVTTPTVNYPRVVYEDKSTGDTTAIDTDDDTKTFSTGDVKALGPMRKDLDGDGDEDLPYVSNNDNLVIIDDGGNTQTLDNSGSVGAKHIGVGDWDGDGTNEVVYVRDGTLYSVDSSAMPTQLTKQGGGQGGSTTISASSVAGVGNFDSSDTDAEIVFVDGSDNLKYTSQKTGGGSANVSNPTDTNVDLDSANAVGRPANFDGDADLEVPFYDNTDKGIDFTGPGGAVTSFDPSYQVAKAPMGAFDYASDGTPEIIHIDNNNNIKYLNPDNGSTGTVGSDTANNGPGVV